MTGGSQQLRIWRRSRRDGDTLMTACVKSGIPLAEARLWDAEDRKNPPPPEAFELLNTAGTSPAKPEEEDMARPKVKSTPITGEVPQPDFDEADKIYANDIAPANKLQKQAMKDASDGWKAVKGAHVHVGGARTAYKVWNMEEAEQQAWLRAFNGVCKKKGIRLVADLVDQAETGAAAGAEPVPVTSERPRPTLVTINHPDDDSDLNPPDEPAAEAGADGDGGSGFIETGSDEQQAAE